KYGCFLFEDNHENFLKGGPLLHKNRATLCPPTNTTSPTPDGGRRGWEEVGGGGGGRVRAYDDDSDKSLIVETMAAGTFLLFAVMCVPYILIVWKLVPETT
ncbi:hypothetical protein, partial [Bacteroides sp. 519]|uniref:hypothetical protein n=1 Tax=Bacteroides sp. 519 TaxID=2302937 RepID=UPI0019402780